MKEPYPVVDRADGPQLWRSGITKLSWPSGTCDGGVRQDGGERMGTWQIRKSVSQEQRTEKQGPFQQMCFAVPEDVYLLSKTI